MDSITGNAVVTLAYTVTDTDGNQVYDGNQDPLNYLHGGYGGIFLPVEAALAGKAVGDSATVKLQPSEAFGEYDPELVDMVSVEVLPQPLAIGMQLEGTSDESGDGPTYATVTDIADGKAVLDCNHPLAGMALIFNCTVLEIREASAEEIAAVPSR